MSDGNFNRALLPSTPYRSGVKMGQQQMLGRALEAFQEVIKETFPTLSNEEHHQLAENFRNRLTAGK